jgi:S1-C subfamily serine protease
MPVSKLRLIVAIGTIAVAVAGSWVLLGRRSHSEMSLSNSPAEGRVSGASQTTEPAMPGPPATGASVAVTGRIIDAASGQALTNLPVQVFGVAKQVVHTDHEGRFSIPGLAGGSALRLVINGGPGGYLRGVRQLVLPRGPSAFDIGDLRLLKGSLRERKQRLGANRGQAGLVLEATAEGNIVVSGVVPGSPAQQAGVEVGSRVAAVDGQVVRDLDLEAVHFLLMKESGAAVDLSLERPGKGDARQVALTLGPLRATGGE